MQWFDNDTIRQIHRTSIKRNLDDKRSVLMGGISPAYVSGLGEADNSADQLMLDLQAMNSVNQIKCRTQMQVMFISGGT